MDEERASLRYARDLVCYRAMGTLRALAADEPLAHGVIRDYDHVDCLIEIAAGRLDPETGEEKQ